jgi:D-serine deaminase-like pyridoxal phosphate-dependent protein
MKLTKQEIPTPALLLDLDLFEQNLERMASHVEQRGKKLRPHCKAHKCPQIARRQIARGAIGMCVATAAEAEMLTEAGIKGLLLTSPVADPVKMVRIVATGAMVVVDHLMQVNWYQDAAYAAGRIIDVLVDLDVGDHRTGVPSAPLAVAVAQAIDRSTHLRLRGIQAYSVLGSHAGGFEQRKKVSEDAFAVAAAVREELLAAGLNVEIVTGGSTGSWQIDTEIPVVTELQAGSYVGMDMAYRREGLDFHNAFHVLASVVSANHDAFVTVDAGFKAFSTDRGYGPEAAKLPGSSYRWGGDEFGYIDLNGARLRVGDRVEFIAPHCDPTANLYDRIYACRGEKVEAVWPVKRVSL